MPTLSAKSSLFQKRVLVVRQDRIGDCVLATGLPREIKRRWPDSQVGVLVRSATKPIFEHNPHVDEILTDDYTEQNRKQTFWPLVGELRRHRFTHALMLLPQARISYLTLWAGIPVRVGFGLTLHHTLSLARPVMSRKFRKGRHEASYAMDLARAIGVQPESEDPEVHLTATETAAAARLRQKGLATGASGGNTASGGGGTRGADEAARPRLIGVHTTSGKSAPNLPPQVWADVVGRLAQTAGIKVVVTDPGVTGPVAGIADVQYIPDGVSLRQGIVNFAALDLLVSASTGPMHIAGALGVPTFSLFCPDGSCAPAAWLPRGNVAHTILPVPEYCGSYCPGDPRICTFSGPSGIDAESVVDHLLRLQDRPATGHTARSM